MTQYVSKSLFKRLVDNIQRKIDKVANSSQKVTKEDIGLGNVDNTADKNKPISDVVQNILDTKQNKLFVINFDSAQNTADKSLNDIEGALMRGEQCVFVDARGVSSTIPDYITTTTFHFSGYQSDNGDIKLYVAFYAFLYDDNKITLRIYKLTDTNNDPDSDAWEVKDI